MEIEYDYYHSRSRMNRTRFAVNTLQTEARGCVIETSRINFNRFNFNKLQLQLQLDLTMIKSLLVLVQTHDLLKYNISTPEEFIRILAALTI